MKHDYFQLDLFIPGIVVDRVFNAEQTAALMHHLHHRNNRITHEVIHPDTISHNMPGFVDVAVNQKRMRLFARSSKCSCCGVEGNTYVIERRAYSPDPNKWLNLYHVSAGSIVEMTVDHTLPRCFGGGDTQINRKTMCFVCNQTKANKMSYSEVETVLKDVRKYVKPWANVEYVTALLKLHSLMLTTINPTQQRRIKGLVNKFLTTIQPSTTQSTYSVKLKQLTAELTRLTPPLPAPVVVNTNWVDTIVKYVRKFMRVNDGKRTV